MSPHRTSGPTMPWESSRAVTLCHPKHKRANGTMDTLSGRLILCCFVLLRGLDRTLAGFTVHHESRRRSTVCPSPSTSRTRTVASSTSRIRPVAVQDTPYRYRYRNAKETDIPSLAQLLVETFDETPTSGNSILNPWKYLLRQDQLKQLRRRWKEFLINPNVAHSWIVVESVLPVGSTGTSSNIVGFMELGTMPLPLAIGPRYAPLGTVGNANVTDDTYRERETSIDSSSGTSIWTEIIINEETTKAAPTSSHVERPFLANLAVSKDHRRQGIATTLVQVALKQSRKWKPSSTESWSMFLGVSYDNESAINLYRRLNFTLSLDETNELSPTMLKRLKRSPRLYFEKKFE